MRRLRHPGRPGTDLLLVLALGAFLRVGVFLAAVGSPQRFFSPDDREYLAIAHRLHASYLAHSGRLFDLGLRRPPGYPLFLRAVFEVFGTHFAAVVAVQVVVSVATIGLVHLLGRLVLSRKAATVAALLLAIEPASVVFANQMMTETIFAFLLTAAVILIVHSTRTNDARIMAAAGLLIGLATLIRPVSAYLPVVLVVVLVVTAARGKRAATVLAAALVGGYLIPAGSWVIRNTSETGVATISTIEGYNMLHYRAVGALVEEGELPWEARKRAHAEALRGLPAGANAAVISRAQMRVGARLLATHPTGAVKSWARGEFRLLAGPGKSETASLLTGRTAVSGGALRALVLLTQLVTLAIVLAAAWGAVALLIGRPRGSAQDASAPDGSAPDGSVLWLIVVTACYLIVISGGPEAYSRFRVPVAPLLAVLAASVLTGRKRAPEGRADAPGRI